MNTTQAPYHQAQICPFVPFSPYALSSPHSVPSRTQARSRVLACQVEPPFEGTLQVVDRLMLADVLPQPHKVFVVRNLQRDPPSAYVCSFEPAGIEFAQTQCAGALALAAKPWLTVVARPASAAGHGVQLQAPRAPTPPLAQLPSGPDHIPAHP